MKIKQWSEEIAKWKCASKLLLANQWTGRWNILERTPGSQSRCALTLLLHMLSHNVYTKCIFQQTERAFRKQHAVVVVRRKNPNLKKRPRFYRQIGLGFRAPAEVRDAEQTVLMLRPPRLFPFHCPCTLIVVPAWPTYSTWTCLPPRTRFQTNQNERAFQKQFGVNLNRKVKPGITKKKVLRRYRDVGLGFKTPREVMLETLPPERHWIPLLILWFFFQIGNWWHLHWQEVPLDRRCEDSWPHPDRCCPQG